MSSYKLVLFDLDGTLCDSWRLVKKTYIETLKHFDANADTSHVEGIRCCHDYYESFRALFRSNNVDDEVYDVANQIYEHNLLEVTPLFSGIEALLEQLNLMSTPWGIVTGKKRKFTERIISQHACLQGYTVLVCHDDLTVGKPSPEGLLSACSQASVDPEVSVYIGDLETDLQAAKACNMPAIFVAYGYAGKDLSKEYDHVFKITSPCQLSELLI